MIERTFPTIFLPGSGNYAPDLTLLRSGPDDGMRFETVYYPGWRRFASGGFTSEAMIAELAAKIAAKVPHGPIRIVGLSIGGHFGYAAALRLRAQGREIGGFCAIDSFMIDTAEATPGWQGRALAQALELLKKRRFGEFAAFARSKFWRAMLRLLTNQFPNLMRNFSSYGTNGGLSTIDPLLEQEMSMRLLVRETAPWLASLDKAPLPLEAPAILLRTPTTAGDDQAWQRRCPHLKIHVVTGNHHSLFEPEHVDSLRQAFVAATSEWQ